MDKSFRIRTDVGKDKVVHVNLQQDYSFLEILSLKINQIDTYKLHVSNYGLLVGRVLANGNFGIPNVKVSVFIPLDDEDSLLSDIKNLYPYMTTSDKDSEGRRYNLLQDSSNDECYRVVGSFPNKRLVLDNDNYIEVFDKYYKFTTVTNKSGDYMLPFIPTGNQEVHTDLDLSDIGILSQRPIDLMYKGYTETLFDNARQFKESTNLNNLAQIISQNNSVHIYPFWGDSNLEEIAISRCDIEIQYKFEPTCVFFGSIVSDNFNNNIGHKCTPSKFAGFNRNLVTGEGTIEMIRKTPDNLVEEFQIQGNRLIDGDGVWCYQIPMNLDYVGTDEYGNIVPTDNPNKGIPTRTCVRFRVSMQETNNEGVSRHRAKYLIPNVQDISVGEDRLPMLENASQFDKCYEFGSATPDEYFRDLYWNKVYSVKNYIPRLQTNSKKNNQNYSALKSANSNNNLNPVPFNHARYRLVFAYRVLCMIMTIVIYIICIVNTLLGALACLCIKIFRWKVCPFRSIVPSCIGFNGGLTEDEDSNREYFPCCPKCGEMECETPGCDKVTDKEELINVVQQTLAQEYDTVNLDFYNDWLNGALYMPLWYWRKTKKKKYFFGLFSKKAVNSFCSCSKNFPKLRVTQNCSLPYDGDYDYVGDLKGEKYHNHYPSKKTFTFFGVIKEFVNKAGLNIYYYAPGIPNDVGYKNGFTEGDDKCSYVRLYSTDIILLGSLNSCDLDNYPNVYSNLPGTTANVPFIATVRQSTKPEEGATYLDDADEEEGYVEVTGMDWLHEGEDGKPKYGAGLLIDLACNAVYTKPKSCINVERMSELGVNSDMYVEEYYSKDNKLETNIMLADGMITRYEIVDHETRAMFASLNNNGFKEKVYNPNTGYNTYKLRYVYPNDFDGHMDSSARNYTSMMDFKTFDIKNQDYINYRFGLNEENKLIPYYAKDGSKYTFPLFNNSLYFYFGLNEGKTAIDKFNNKFNATCYKNEKFPFTFDVETSPAAWCTTEGQYDEYATINVLFNTIKMPYSYTLYNEFDEELISEENISLKELKFGYKIEDGKYKEERDGRLQYIKPSDENEPYVLNDKGEYILLENGIYTLEIIDSNGNKGIQKIVIDQVPISLEYTSVPLGNKWYEDGENKSVPSDFCNPNEFYGEINIQAIIIDGKRYKIDNCAGSGNDYDLVVSNDEGTVKDVKLKFTPKNITGFTLQECTCNGVGNIQYAEITPQNVLKFNIWIPQNYDVEVTEVCNTNPIPNTTKVTIRVLNGEPFNVFLNEVPLRLIIGKNEEPTKYNELLYNGGKPEVNIKELIKFWNNVNDEDSYMMPPVNNANKDIWGDFVSVTTELLQEENADGSFSDTIEQDLTYGAKLNILDYKLESIFNMCETVYLVNDDNPTMHLTYKGGKSPYLVSGVYPQYDEINDYDEIETYRYDREGYVTVESSHPNIIGYNYTTTYNRDSRYEYGYSYNEDYDYPRRVLNSNSYKGSPKFNFNPLIDYDGYTEQGNYFAGFTKNGGYPEVGEIQGENPDYCRQLRDKKYQQYPYSATPHINGIIECPSGYTDGEYSVHSIVKDVQQRTRPHFRALYIDKRLDYSIFIMTPYAGNAIESIGEDDTWKKGSIYCEFYNGIAMAYDSEYNIIGNGLEYEVDYNNTFKTTLKPYSVGDGRRFFKAELKVDSKATDIRNDIKMIADPSRYEYQYYPLIREYSNKEVPSGNKITMTFDSCSYSIDKEVIDDGETQIMKGVVEGAGELEFQIDCRDMINVQLPSLEECAANDTYNCRFNDWDGNALSSDKFRLEFKMKQDANNDTHSIYTYLPYLIRVKDKGNAKNFLNDLKSIPISGNSASELESNITAFNIIFKALQIVRFWPTKDTDDDITDEGWATNLGRFFSSRILFPNSVKHWRLKEEGDNTIAYDGVTEIKNIIYSCNKDIKNHDVLGIAYFRNYLNTNGDNLTKEICTFQVTSLFDVRKIQIRVTDEQVVDLMNTETKTETETTTETVTTGTASVTTSSTETSTDPETGEETTTTTTGTSTGSINADSSSSSESTSESTSTTKIQYTQYTISWTEGSLDLNQQFINSDKMTAVFKIGSKITSNINITAQENSAVFDVYWNGDLEDVFLDTRQRVKLFIQMPNKMIYMLEFYHWKGKIITGV